MDSAEEIARLIEARKLFGGHGGVLITNPVPAESEISRGEMGQYIDAAIAEAARRDIRGKAVTPFVLGHIFELTKGRSLVTNIALVRNNARLAAAIAVAVAAAK